MIAKQTGKQHCHVMRDARKMLTKLYGPEYPFRHELTRKEVFCMVAGTSNLPLVDLLFPPAPNAQERNKYERIIDFYEKKVRYHKPRGTDCTGFEKQIRFYKEQLK